MLTTIFNPPTAEQRRQILEDYGFKYDESKFPTRCHFGRNSCAWLLSDVLWWVRNPPAVENVNNPYNRKSA